MQTWIVIHTTISYWDYHQLCQSLPFVIYCILDHRIQHLIQMSLSFNSSLAFEDFNRGYAITMFSIWGIGVDIPRLLIRYGKAYPPVINIHSISMLIIGLFTIMYVIAQIAIFNNTYGPTYAGLSGTQMGQFVLSILLCCLIIIQFILGFLTRVQMFRSSLSSSLFVIKRIHKILGNVMTLIGKVLATLIVNLNTSAEIFKAWLFFLAAIAFLWIAAEMIYRASSKSIIYKYFFKHKNKFAKYHNEIYQKLLQKKQKFESYQFKGIRYVIIDNCMYYIDENFMHPGGEHIFSILNGKEINYYLKGVKAISHDHPRHVHTKYVAKYLENRLIGELEVEPFLINQKMANDLIDWKIASTVKTNYPGTYLVTLQTDSGSVRQQYRIQNFGKYVMMGCSTEETLSKTERPYYFCFSLSDYQRSILDKLRNYYKYYYYGENINDEEDKKSRVKQSTTSKITFFVKEYRYGQFSRFLLNAPKERHFNISGPFGRGLNIKQKTRDYYLIIAAGINIVPFVDLFTYLLQKTLFDLIKIKASHPSLKRINSEGGNFECLGDIKILLVGSFTSSDKFYLSTPIKQLYYLNKKHGLKNFNMMLHYENSQVEQEIKMVKESFNRQFFVNLIEEQEPQRVIFAGPSAMEKIMRKAEPEIKIKTDIYYL